jgi:L-ascorbate metabolism protein UlaG (beta-lactamase superfamily)
MLIKYLAHATFLISAQDGTKIVIDPYHTAPGFSYTPVSETADIVTMSHKHGDHNAAELVKGHPQIVSEAVSQTIKGIAIKGVPSFHDAQGGAKAGQNIMYRFTIDGLTLCHLGDLGHALDAAQLNALKPVDVLLIPVGGFFTIDAKTAGEVATALEPKIIIPMHYKTAKSEGLPIATVEGFLKDKKNVRRPASSSLEVSKATLPSSAEIIVLIPANQA